MAVRLGRAKERKKKACCSGTRLREGDQQKALSAAFLAEDFEDLEKEKLLLVTGKRGGGGA